MTEPTTEAGRAFLAPYCRDGRISYGYVEVPTEDILELILAIEAEAASLARQAVANVVEDAKHLPPNALRAAHGMEPYEAHLRYEEASQEWFRKWVLNSVDLSHAGDLPMTKNQQRVWSVILGTTIGIAVCILLGIIR